MNLKEPIIFFNARDIEGDVLSFLFCELKLPDIYKKHKNMYLYLANLLLTIQHKHLFIIVDAINENDSEGFGSNIAEFINEITKYSRINIDVYKRQLLSHASGRLYEGCSQESDNWKCKDLIPHI